MITHKYVSEFIDSYKAGEIKLNKERILMIDWIERDILTRNDIYFDEEQIENFVKFTAKWYFPLRPFQKFMACFIFLKYKEDDTITFDEFFFYMARGAGKNGFVSALSHYLISELHGIPFYGVTVVANSEKQAQTSFNEVYNVIDLHPALKSHFIHRKAKIEDRKTKSEFTFSTSNAETKDGGRQGLIIYDEVHQYESSEIVDVFSGGLGKVRDSREIFIGTDGFIRDKFIDKLKQRAMNILTREVPLEEDSLFPFMCNLDEEDEMHNPEMWEKANPQFHGELTPYAKTLYKKVMKQYKKLENDSSGYENFVTKRMNLPKVDLEKSVTSWEKILGTNQEYDLRELKSRECIGVLDYASIRDFVACGLLFFKDNKHILPKELFHEYVCKPFADKHYGYSRNKAEGNNKKDHRKFAPIREWEEDGLLTVLDKEAMDPFLVVQWYVDRRNEGWNIKKIIADNFRMEILRPIFESEGFEVETIRNPDAASALMAPKIELAFDENRIVWGDNPMLRWNCNNVYVKIDARGNKLYRKKEETKRKTDGFMAFVYGMWATRDLNDYDIESAFDALSELSF